MLETFYWNHCLSKKRNKRVAYKIDDGNSSQRESEDDSKGDGGNEIFELSVNSMHLKRSNLKVNITGCKMKLLVDTGSSINVTDEKNI